MKRLVRIAIFALVLMSMPLRQWGQTPYRQYSEEGIVMDFHKIDNVDFRLFLLYNLSQDDRFVLVPEQEYGQFVLTMRDENGHFGDVFEDFYRNVTADFALLTKNDIFEQMNTWKAAVAPEDFLSITMDIALRNSRVDNEHCANSLPFCTSDLIEFEAASTSQTANEPGMDDGCIGSSYNPSFYHMRIHTAGEFVIHMEGHDPSTNAERDIDFCMWGPYTEEEVASGYACTHLSSNKIIDCCYSSHYTEDCFLGYAENLHEHNTSHGSINYHMPEVGEYYILMITNFSQQPCVINFTKDPESGPGETDCDILPGIASNSGPYCEGQTIQLFVNEQMNATYEWTGPNNFHSTEQNPVILNCTLEMAGEYTVITTVGTQSTPATTIVEIYQQPTPSFDFTTVCQGEETQFNGHATGSNVAIYEWDFGDGQIDTESGQNTSHVYEQAGPYEVTLTVSAEDGSCPGHITQTVVVNAQPVANAGTDQSLPYPGTSTELSGTGGDGNFNYRWEPADKVTNPNAANTSTVVLYETQTYTLTVTNPQGQCVSSDNVTVYIGSSPLIVTVEAEPDHLCLGESTHLEVGATGGSSNFSYSWSPTTGLSNPNIYNPVANPSQTTTYTCTVADNTTLDTQNVSVTVTVNMPQVLADTLITDQCDRVEISWFGQDTVFNANTEYTFEGLTPEGCHREQTFRITNMMYEPQPEISCADPEIEWPHHPITATEFNVNRYTYTATDSISDYTWINSECEWTISQESWRIEPSDDNRSCMVYPMDYVSDTIWLTFKAVSPCSEEGIEVRYWLKASFYGIEEDAYSPAIDIVPNPNNGQMQLRMENMEGRVNVKVCNATGLLIDQFEIQTRQGLNTYNYTMERLSNGVYFLVFTDGKHSVTKKVVIIN